MTAVGGSLWPFVLIVVVAAPTASYFWFRYWARRNKTEYAALPDAVRPMVVKLQRRWHYILRAHVPSAGWVEVARGHAEFEASSVDEMANEVERRAKLLRDGVYHARVTPAA